MRSRSYLSALLVISNCRPAVSCRGDGPCAHHQLHLAASYDAFMAGESELVVVAEGDTPDGARWQVRAGGTADEYLHAWKVISADGEWDSSGVGGPALPTDGRLVDVYCSIRNPGRPDQGPLRVHVRADPRVRRLHLVTRDGDECDALPVADDPRVGVTLFFVPTTWMVRLRSVQAFDAGGQPLTPPAPALCAVVPLEPRDRPGQVVGGDRRLAPVAGDETPPTTITALTMKVVGDRVAACRTSQ